MNTTGANAQGLKSLPPYRPTSNEPTSVASHAYDTPKLEADVMGRKPLQKNLLGVIAVYARKATFTRPRQPILGAVQVSHDCGSQLWRGASQ